MAAAAKVPRVDPAELQRRDNSDSEGSLGLADDSFSSDGEAAEADRDGKSMGSSKDGDAAASSGGQSAGWADAMARILGKQIPESKPGILLKNKKLERERAKEKQKKLDEKKQHDKKQAWEMMCRVKPDIVKDRESERNLQRIATRGVVQLFNAVRKHQSNIDEKIKEVGTSERKRTKLMSSVSKRDFISVLRGQDGRKTEQSTVEKPSKSKKVASGSREEPGWSILRDDFMMGAAMKDWDRESDEGGEGSAPRGRAKKTTRGSDSDPSPAEDVSS
ncbi:RRP15-like protein [Rhinatrema bivittatum]|uniref:RRP15-like protein n=1 Tax=Rhinatrema bivittatum TaxID=194408 RepID=UPI00112899B0|nr:RRP15-like protein [Rhinatrema bivittatum]